MNQLHSKPLRHSDAQSVGTGPIGLSSQGSTEIVHDVLDQTPIPVAVRTDRKYDYRKLILAKYSSYRRTYSSIYGSESNLEEEISRDVKFPDLNTTIKQLIIFRKNLTDILNGVEFTSSILDKDSKFEKTGYLGNVLNSFVFENFYEADIDSLILQCSKSFMLVNKITNVNNSDYITFGLKDTKTRDSLRSSKSTGLVQGYKKTTFIMHMIGDHLALCTAGQIHVKVPHTQCVCQYIPILSYKVCFDKICMDAKYNSFSTIHSEFDFESKLKSRLDMWIEKLLPIFPVDSFIKRIGNFTNVQVLPDDFSETYEDVEQLNYTFQKNEDISFDFTIPVRHLQNGTYFMYHSDLTKFISRFLMNLLNEPQMFGLSSLASFGSKEILEQVQNCLSKISGTMDTTNEMVAYLANSGPKFLILCLACFASYAVIRKISVNEDEPLHRVYALLPLVALIATDKIRKLFDFCFSSTKPTAQSQGDLPWNSIFTLLVAVCGFVSNVTNLKFQPKDLFTMFSQLPRAVDGWEKSLDALITSCTYIFDAVKAHIFGEVHLPSTQSVFPKVQAFYEGCAKFVQLSHESKLSVNVENYDSITRLQTEGLNLIIHGKYGPESRSIITQIKFFLTMLDKLRKPFEQSTIRTSFSRVEPLTLLFRGASGVGKSTLSKPFITALLTRLLEPHQVESLKNNLDSHIYTRTPETKYWDGYKGQFVTVMDDFGQCYDVVGDPDNEYMSLIRCTNRFPYVLHMASLEDKGSNVFNSKVIFCSTNESNFNTVQSIKCKEALLRRFDYIVNVIVNPAKDANGEYIYGEHRVGNDDLKIKKGVAFSTDAWLIQICEGVNEVSAGHVVQTVDFDTFIGMCAGTYLSKTDVFEDINVGCDNLLHDSIAQRLKETNLISKQDEETFVDGFSTETLDNSTQSNLQNKPQGVLGRLYEDFSCFLPFDIFRELFFHYTLVEGQKDQDANSEFYDCGFKKFLQSLLGKYNELKTKFKDFSSYCSSITLRLPEYMIKKSSLLLSSIIKNVKTAYDIVKELHSKFPILSFISVWSSIAVLLKFLFSMFSNMANSNPKMSRRPAKGRATKEARQYGFDAHGPDTAVQNMTKKLITKNCLLLSLPGNDPTMNKSGIVIGLAGNICMLPSHYFVRMQILLDEGKVSPYEDVDFHFQNGVIFRTLTVDQFMQCDRYYIKDKDMCLFNLDKGAAMFPNITTYFPTKKTYDCIDNAECTLHTFETCEGMYLSHEITAKKRIGPLFYRDCDGNEFTCQNSVSYEAETFNGDCGSLLIRNDSSFDNGIILGIHVAGSSSLLPFGWNRVGFASVIFYEEIQQAINHFETIYTQGPSLDPNTMVECEENMFLNAFPIIGKAKQGLALSAAPKSKLVKMIDFYGLMGECTIKPAFLNTFVNGEGEKINPRNRAILKYYGSQCFMDTKLVKLCAEDAFNDMSLNSKFNVDKTILTFEEAVEGILGEDYIDGIPRATSAGWPKNKQLNSRLRGKKEFFGEDGQYIFDSESTIKLKEETLEILNKAKKGIRSSVVFMDCLKDETRPAYKADMGKTRLISAAPLAYLIACRMVFLRFNQWVMKNRIANGIAIGVNPYSIEWSGIVEKLHEVSSTMFAGDYGSYDSSQTKQVGDEICEGINRWYNDCEELQMARRVFFMDIYSSVHISGDTIYQWTKSLPSGHPLTTTVNSIYNKIILRMGFVTSMGRSYNALTLYRKFIREIVYGDDNIVSVNEIVQDKFNISSMAEFCQTIYMDYTDETKSDQLNTAFREISDISFLKRGFVLDKKRNKYIAPLDKEVVRQMLYYLNKNVDQTLVVQSASDSFLREASLHEPEFYTKCVETYKDIWATKYSYVAKTVDPDLARSLTLCEEFQY
jgi:hypothetical protein